jgi:hypothetical protein
LRGFLTSHKIVRHVNKEALNTNMLEHDAEKETFSLFLVNWLLAFCFVLCWMKNRSCCCVLWNFRDIIFSRAGLVTNSSVEVSHFEFIGGGKSALSSSRRRPLYFDDRWFYY